MEEKEILNQLDLEAERFTFPMLDNGYFYHGDQKLTIFRDEKRWAMLIEVLAYNNHSIGIDGIHTIAYTFGNCILTANLNDNENFFYFANDNGEQTFLYDEENYIPYLNSEVKSIKIKDKEVYIRSDKEFYISKGITLKFDNKITPWEFMRGLIPDKSNLFWVTRQEISKKIPIDLPIFMTLEQWHHPNLVAGEKPSETETFKQLAKVIATGDKTIYNTTEEPNTHWKNWPEGGTL